MENKERFKLIPLVGLILIKEDKILLLRRFQTGFEDGKYSFIAGHVDGNESMTEAMAREAKEEAGIIIDPGKLKHTLTMHRTKRSNAILRQRTGLGNQKTWSQINVMTCSGFLLIKYLKILFRGATRQLSVTKKEFITMNLVGRENNIWI